MAKLVFSFGGAFMGEFPLDKERTTIGRRTYNDIHIDNLAISGEHAVVVATGDRFYVEDLESTNGTVVNGKPVKKYKLHHGDVIGLGKYQLEYLDESNVNSKSGPKTLPQADAVSEDGSPQVKAQPGVIQSACLRVLTGRNPGQLLELNKSITTLGKPGVQVAAIVRRPQGFFIVHVDGETRPTVNGEQVSAKMRRLEDSDLLEIAGVRMEFLSSMPES